MSKLKLIAALAVALIAIIVVLQPRLRNRYAAPSPGKHKVTLTWTTVSTVTSYNVYRSSQRDGGYVKIATSVQPPYVNLPVPTPGTFFYTVTAVNDRGESGYAVPVEAVVP